MQSDQFPIQTNRPGSMSPLAIRLSSPGYGGCARRWPTRGTASTPTWCPWTTSTSPSTWRRTTSGCASSAASAGQQVSRGQGQVTGSGSGSSRVQRVGRPVGVRSQRVGHEVGHALQMQSGRESEDPFFRGSIFKLRLQDLGKLQW